MHAVCVGCGFFQQLSARKCKMTRAFIHVETCIRCELPKCHTLARGLCKTSHDWDKFCNFTTVGLISRICIKQSELIALWACSMVVAWVWHFLILPPSVPLHFLLVLYYPMPLKAMMPKSRMNRMLFLASTTDTSFASWFNDLKKSPKQQTVMTNLVYSVDSVCVSILFVYLFSKFTG